VHDKAGAFTVEFPTDRTDQRRAVRIVQDSDVVVQVVESPIHERSHALDEIQRRPDAAF
jgi:hypothetical protein